jgi:xanthine dehydrogenase YagS FAD-binding subunit
LGGVAHKPWRATAAEQMITGHALDSATLQQAAAAALAEARPQRDNAFKVRVAQNAIVRAVNQAAAGASATGGFA